jgi:hypothetical protein
MLLGFRCALELLSFLVVFIILDDCYPAQYVFELYYPLVRPLSFCRVLWLLSVSPIPIVVETRFPS